MDIKITSITPEIMRIALDQARDGRLHILGEMSKAITGARGDVAATAGPAPTILCAAVGGENFPPRPTSPPNPAIVSG